MAKHKLVLVALCALGVSSVAWAELPKARAPAKRTLESRVAALEKKNAMLTKQVALLRSVVQIKGNNVTIQATDDLTIKSVKGNLSLEAKDDLSGEAGSNVELQAGSNATLEAGSSATLEGGDATIKGSSSATVKGDRSLQLEGDQLHLKGSKIGLNTTPNRRLRAVGDHTGRGHYYASKTVFVGR